MTTAIVYTSRTGNTRLLAEALEEVLPDCLYFGPPSPQALTADRIYVGFWTNRGRCDGDTAEFLKTLSNQQVFLFGTAGFGENAAYFDKIVCRTARNLPRSAKLIGSYVCQGKMPMTVRSRYEAMLARPIHPPHIKALLKNFDRALPHPDPQDLEALRSAVRTLP